MWQHNPPKHLSGAHAVSHSGFQLTAFISKPVISPLGASTSNGGYPPSTPKLIVSIV
ncbi:hypothetical protein Y11_09491 [Yersinia enterocolitica subsp. palearctica Y11]|uniref:Uncharacterized protein n=1 Tax=Yersinia enterocolitica subsp. palearctica serotype O:3 (strain DSM 13030 / CIP 106945 / Y11) TaxID=930944 RepID=A0A0H3NQ62_YERE1|nr:hypothetical protein Y11_09491 [Yersinia enterocolitica subsp. palearctica Y11]